MLQINHGDQDQNRHIGTDEQQMPAQAVTIVKKRIDRCRAQFDHDTPQRPRRTTIRTMTFGKQIAGSRKPRYRPALDVTMRTIRHPHPRLVRQCVRQSVQYPANQQSYKSVQ